MAAKPLPPTELLRQLFRYEPESGNLYHKEGPRAGQQAFTCKNGNGYFYGAIGREKFSAHRIIWKMVTGADPKYHIDHIDGCETNNRFENLRDVTIKENGRNRSIQVTNSSSVSGVGWETVNKRWRARIWDGKQINIGSYRTKEEAIAARKQYEKMLGYHENHGRPKN